MDQKITDQLPHGSGINGMWQIETKGKIVTLSNTFEAMNESDMHCHDYQFEAVYEPLEGLCGSLALSHVSVKDNDPDCECGWGLDEYLDALMPVTVRIET